MIRDLQDDNGNWYHSPNDIQSSILSFYSNLFSTGDSSSPLKCQNIPSSHGSISTKNHPLLANLSSSAENKKTVFSFNPYKPPVPDGIYPLVYQKYWSILGQATVKFCTESFTNAFMELNSQHYIPLPHP